MKYITNWTVAFITLFLLVFLRMQDNGLVETARLKSFDYLQSTDSITQSQGIVVVEIDEAAIEANGQWPWSRDKIADLIWKLREQGAGIIILPILFAEEDRAGQDMALAQALVENGVIIAQVGTTQTNKNSVPRGVAKIGDPLPWLFEWPGMLGPTELLGLNADGVGVINIAPEIDGVVRRVPLIMRVGEETYPAMAIEMIRVAVGDPSYQIKAGEAGVIAVRVPGYDTIYTDQHARIWLRWNKQFPTISMTDDLSVVAGKTVVVGLTAEGLASTIASPSGTQYAHTPIAVSLATIINGENIQRTDLANFYELLYLILIGLMLVVASRFVHYYYVAGTIIVLAIGTVYGAVLAYSKYLLLFDFSWPVITIMIVGLHAVFNRFVREFQLKQQIRKQFEKYLDPRQVAILVKHPEKLKLGGDRKEMSFLFMDIVGFTPISEYYKNNDDPEGLVNVIDDYLNRMSKIVLANGGTIDKYMGDCIMAFWNAPLDCDNHAEMAVKTAIECAEETDKIKAEFKERGLPDINIGSGVNTGTCIVGNMGSEMRLDYSVIGDAVNLAARLEAATRNYKDENGKVTPTLYSSYTMEQLTDIKSIEVDKIKVKGKEELITIYKPA
ncbi:MAG: adenylate/guanylate cyclase domain-containing protein [Bacteroidota bacterium]|nr:adenylate/guanylate cyclase domain-containing protein [Bacteroidota bacterium]